MTAVNDGVKISQIQERRRITKGPLSLREKKWPSEYESVEEFTLERSKNRLSSEAEKKGNDCAERFKHVRRRWNDPFGTFFSFIITKVGEKKPVKVTERKI